MVDLNAHEAGNGGQSQAKPTAPGVLLYSEAQENSAQTRERTIRSAEVGRTLAAAIEDQQLMFDQH